MTITPVIFSAPKQRFLVARLVRHCLNLDGTEVRVIEAPEPQGMGYPEICNWSFLHTSNLMKDTPFFWLEADSIPLRPGWLGEIEREWQVAQGFGKSVLWTSDSHPPDDLCTGIGVYAAGFHRLLPDTPMKDIGFDGYTHRELSHHIHHTPLIQHSYGRYANGKCSLWRNPKPRDTAVVFHKDQYQDLIP